MKRVLNHVPKNRLSQIMERARKHVRIENVMNVLSIRSTYTQAL